MQLRDTGLRTFFWIWLGELVSLLGSRLTSFALGVWVYQTTGSATSFALNLFFIIVPGIILAPFVGVWVDRWDVRKVMIISDSDFSTQHNCIIIALFNQKYVCRIYLYLWVD